MNKQQIAESWIKFLKEEDGIALLVFGFRVGWAREQKYIQMFYDNLIIGAIKSLTELEEEQRSQTAPNRL